MTRINHQRVFLGAVIGFIGFAVLGGLISTVILAARYAAAQKDGFFLETPRYPFFMPAWLVTLFLVSWIGATLYAATRETWGAGPLTALKVGFLLGFASGFPLSFTSATWLPCPRIFPLFWMIELWAGTMLATFMAGWFYKPKP